jgi:hypothetical protein
MAIFLQILDLVAAPSKPDRQAWGGAREGRRSDGVGEPSTRLCAVGAAGRRRREIARPAASWRPGRLWTSRCLECKSLPLARRASLPR